MGRGTHPTRSPCSIYIRKPIGLRARRRQVYSANPRAVVLCSLFVHTIAGSCYLYGVGAWEVGVQREVDEDVRQWYHQGEAMGRGYVSELDGR